MNSRNKVLKPFIEKNDYMQDRIRNGIESGRKSFCKLYFRTKNGDAVRHVHVKAVQTAHAFKHGANIFMLDEFKCQEQNTAYKKLFSDCFDIATLPFYWNTLEPKQGEPRFAKNSPKIYRRPSPDLCLEFCEDNGIEPKGHCLNYVGFTAPWVGDNVRKVKMLMTKRMRELSERYAQRIPSWEVTNETLFHADSSCAFYYAPDQVEWSFRTAEKFFPGNALIINEAQENIWSNEKYRLTRSPYYMQIERALAKGCRIDSIGMQYHMFFREENESASTAEYYDPERIYGVMDTYANLGFPMQITEMTIPAYSCKEQDEEIQSEIIRNLYSIFFSHPAMEAVIYWNLVDGFANGGKEGDMTVGENYYHGGLVRYDFTAKPAYHVVKELFEKTWHTECELDSEDASFVMFKGFHGMYDLEITANNRVYHRRIVLQKENGLICKHNITLETEDQS